MNQAFFGDRASFDDWGLTLTGVRIGLPEPKRTTIEIPGRDGKLDLSAVLTPEIKYRNREIVLQFSKNDYKRQWKPLLREITDHIHGKRLDVIVDPDLDWYWDATCGINNFTFKGNRLDIDVLMDCAPYKLKKDLTVYTAIATPAGSTVLCRNAEKTVVPLFRTSGQCVITCGDITKSVAAGEHEIYGLKFKKGWTEVTAKGQNVQMEICYREGHL